jgi:predicted MFS family arabinose efflux permease
MPTVKPGLVHYEDVDQQYLDQRKLKPSAGWILLAAMGVGAVISGDFFGWHFGLKYGFRALAIATVAMAIMYFCMVYTIAELSACRWLFLVHAKRVWPTGWLHLWVDRRNRIHPHASSRGHRH